MPYFAIGSIVASAKAQPSNFTITPGNMTAGAAVLNCANGRSLTMADINKGQTCSNTNPTPTPSASSNNTTVTPTSTPAVTKLTMINYKDPEGRFTINYPADWSATPAENRFATSLVEFSNPQPLATLDVRLVKSVPVDVETMMVKTFGTTYDIPNFQLNQGVECQKYTIDGSKACSIIYTRTLDYSSDIKYAVMTVETVLKGDAYIFVCSSNLDNFDSNLPTIDKMINSFKIPTTGVH